MPDENWIGRHPKTTSIFAMAVGASVALGVVLTVSSSSVWGTNCSLGGEVATALIWTPAVLVNIPAGGSGSWGASRLAWTFTSGPLVVGGLSGPGGTISESGTPQGSSVAAIDGFVSLDRWGLFRAYNVSLPFKAGGGCTQPYVAEMLADMGGTRGVDLSSILPLPNNTSDAIEPHVVPVLSGGVLTPTPGASVWFDTAYRPTNTLGAHESESISLCNAPETGTFNISLQGAAAYPIVVSITTNGQNLSSSGSVVWQGPVPGYNDTVGYSLPGNWVWNISTVSSGVLPTVADASASSLLAFERFPCPAGPASVAGVKPLALPDAHAIRSTLGAASSSP